MPAVSRMLGFQEEAGVQGGRALITGLVIVDADAASQFTNLSGRDRWYVEYVRKDLQPKQGVQWLIREGDENAYDYAGRAESLNKGMGIARGHKLSSRFALLSSALPVRLHTRFRSL